MRAKAAARRTAVELELWDVKDTRYVLRVSRRQREIITSGIPPSEIRVLLVQLALLWQQGKLVDRRMGQWYSRQRYPEGPNTFVSPQKSPA